MCVRSKVITVNVMRTTTL